MLCIRFSKKTILLIESDVFHLLGEFHCWWTRESMRVHVAKFNGRPRLISSILKAVKISSSTLIEIVTLLIFYTMIFDNTLFWYFCGITFQLFETS